MRIVSRPGLLLAVAIGVVALAGSGAGASSRCDKEAGNDCRDTNPGTVDAGTATSTGAKKPTSGATNVKTPRDAQSGQARGRRVHSPQ
ncbi:MAG: hypothetical protein HY659_12680 [Rhizobiales bacterium]|nr:hypothetical protein [Hyphomicrobiales bacterium]